MSTPETSSILAYFYTLPTSSLMPAQSQPGVGIIVAWLVWENVRVLEEKHKNSLNSSLKELFTDHKQLGAVTTQNSNL